MKTKTINPQNMKKMLLLLLLFTGMVNAQDVYFPDTNFKQALLTTAYVENLAGFYINADANFDGEIQYSEAMDISRIEVNGANITDLSGIEAFFNLRHLQCNDNQLTTLNLQNFALLEDVSCSNNLISSLLLTGCTNLNLLICSNNQLTFLDISGFPLLNELDCDNNTISVLSTIDCPNLTYLNFNNNPLLYVDVTNCSSLVSLSFNVYNSLNTLNLSGCTSLNFLNLGYSQLNSLVLQNLTSLTNLQVNYNANLTNLTLTNCPNISNFNCSNNNLSAINVSGLNNMTQFNCSYNPITSLDLSTTNNISSLFCGNTQVSTLTVSNLLGLTYFWFPNNSQLQTIFAKNGQNETMVLDNNPNLTFICADDSQVASVQNQLNTAGMTSTVVDSYCSFVPGGNYNTITGIVRYDANNNGCDVSDIVEPLIRVNINDGTNQGATFTNVSGNYSFYTQAGNFTLSPIVENPTWFTISPSNPTISFANNNNNIATQNFCIAPVGSHTDLEIVIEPVTPARPGFDAVYKLVYRNKGNVNPGFNSGARFEFNPNQMTFVSASQVVGTQGANFVNFDYSNLLPFESRSITVTFHINSPIDTNPVNIGDILNLHANVGLNIGDENPIDNDFYYNQTVVGAFDPNNIVCIEGPTVATTEIGKYLHYAINFENTGNYAAQNVVVSDVIDATKYDVASLQMLNASNPVYTRLNGNVIEFVFQNINLAPAAGNPPVGGHGNVLFKIKSKSTLTQGDFVAKSSNIYFDYNAPITTNTAQTTFAALNNAIHQLDASVSVYPNPTNSILTINASNTISSVELFDIQGRILETSLGNENQIKIDLSGKQNGIYFVKVNTEKGSKVEKVIKE